MGVQQQECSPTALVTALELVLLAPIAKHLVVDQFVQVVKMIALQRKDVVGVSHQVGTGSVKLGIWRVHLETRLIVNEHGIQVGIELQQVCVFL